MRILCGPAPFALLNLLKPIQRSAGPSPRQGRCARIALARASPAPGPAPDPRGALGGAQRPASSRAAGLGRREGQRGQTKRLMNGRARRAVRSPRARAAPRGAGASGECALDAPAASSTAGAAPGSGTAPLSVRGGPGGGCVPWVHPAGPLTAAPRATGGPRPQSGAAAELSTGSFIRCPAPATSWHPQAGAGRRACPGRGAGSLRDGDTSRCHASWCLTLACASGSDSRGFTNTNLTRASAPQRLRGHSTCRHFLFLLSFLGDPTRLCWDGCGSSLCVKVLTRLVRVFSSPCS